MFAKDGYRPISPMSRVSRVKYSAKFELSDDNLYSKNEFLTFVRESIREASSTMIHAKCLEWHKVAHFGVRTAHIGVYYLHSCNVS